MSRDPRHCPAPTRWGQRLATAMVLLLGALLLAGPAAADAKSPDRATFGIGPAGLGSGDPRGYFSYQMGAGGSYKDKVAVVNYGLTPLSLGVFAADLGNNADGGLGVGLQKEEPRDAGAWIRLPRQLVTVTVAASGAKGPGRAIIPFAIDVPSKASPGDHGAALVAVLSSVGKNAQGANVRLDQRIAARVYIRVAGDVRPKLSIEGLSASYRDVANPVGEGRATVRYTVRNTGNVRVGATQSIFVSGLLGTKSLTLRPPKIELLFPGASETVTVTVKGVLPTVRMHAQVTVNPLLFQDQKPVPVSVASATVGFWAIPWTLIVLLLLILLLCGVFVRRRRSGTTGPLQGGRHALRRKRGLATSATVDEPKRTTAVLRLALLTAGLAAVLPAVPAVADQVPFTDPNAQGYIGLCDDKGHSITSGSLKDKPFVVLAVSSSSAPTGYEPRDAAKATLFAYQPIDGYAPGDWSGQQLTGSSAYSNTQHPMSAGTILDYSMGDFVTAYPPKWDHLVQLRMAFGAPRKAPYFQSYPAAVLKIQGDRWTVVQGGEAPCTAGKAMSTETILLPKSRFASPLPNTHATGMPSTHADGTTTDRATAAPNADSGTAKGTPSPGAAPQPALADQETKRSTASGAFPLVLVIVVALGLALTAGLWWRRRAPHR